jgi:hypothetical protein
LLLRFPNRKADTRLGTPSETGLSAQMPAPHRGRRVLYRTDSVPMGNGIWHGFVAHTTQDLLARIGIHAGSTSAELAAALRMLSNPGTRKRRSNAGLEPLSDPWARANRAERRPGARGAKQP